MKLVVISDTHERFHRQEDLPPADLLIHCGDFTNQGYLNKVEEFARWLHYVADKYTKIIVIAGNHDLTFDEPEMSRGSRKLTECGPSNLIYLNHSQYIFNDIVIFGSPFTPRFGDWAFNVDRGASLAAKWANIPANTDILVTHGPAYGILDPGRLEEHVGCEALTTRLKMIAPRLHLFGHCHNGYGRYREAVDSTTLHINSASCDEMHNLVNKPQIIIL